MSTREFHSHGRVLASHRSGRDDGPAFVLVHGIGMGHGYWSPLADELGTLGPVHSIDLPGFGDAPEPDEPLDMAGSGELLAEFIDVTGLRDVVLIGHSMGTEVATEAAVARPDLLDALVLIAPTVNDAERSIGMQTLRMLQDLWSPHPMVLWYGLVYYVKAGPRWYLKKLRTMMAHRVEERYPFVRTPTLVIRGQHDPVAPRDWVERVAAAIPGAVAAEVPGRGHETMITGHREVAAQIRALIRAAV
ncbi:alpha/beta fold hydrolase [Mycetocola reblochoni]|uniref:Hydrolase, alpha/beta hydrolase fold family n=2 Tax=Mycetocola reblochoni TaxID=331618 RepID=A0A1R4K9H6_9MICO|nr:alpha/beta hydrolase [Mycetocola reblochoni]RLP71158.1 alpha/beta hydrolase [Mycetocola reblochoni]SJN40967.1 Hydrolase, alpha/beta hydrolase fold family [Mycetocola reblochoni REB411]